MSFEVGSDRPGRFRGRPGWCGPRGDGPQRARVDGNGAESALRIPASACFPVT